MVWDRYGSQGRGHGAAGCGGCRPRRSSTAHTTRHTITLRRTHARTDEACAAGCVGRRLIEGEARWAGTPLRGSIGYKQATQTEHHVWAPSRTTACVFAYMGPSWPYGAYGLFPRLVRPFGSVRFQDSGRKQHMLLRNRGIRSMRPPFLFFCLSIRGRMPAGLGRADPDRLIDRPLIGRLGPCRSVR